MEQMGGFADEVNTVMEKIEETGAPDRCFKRCDECVEEDVIVPIKRKDQPFLLKHFYKPQNIDIIEYCSQFVNYEPCLSPQKGDFIGVIRRMIPRQIPILSLAKLLELTDSFLRFSGNWSSSLFNINLLVPTKQLFDYYVNELSKYRSSGDLKKFKKDAECFLQLYQNRKGQSKSLNHKRFWGSRQQMLSGKVIGDFVAADYGPIDPIFGVLLNPTTGRVGSGDSTCIHNLLFEYNGTFGHHAAVHDAFGYLKNYHNIGPGYNYLGVFNTFSSTNSLAGQISGLLFWHSML